MGNGSSIHTVAPKSGPFWSRYCRQPWRSVRVRQLDEFLGLQRPAIKRGDSSSNLEELVRKLTQDSIPLLADGEDHADLQSAIAKLNSGSILHTEKRAIERLLAQRYEEALAAAAAAADKEGDDPLGGASEVLRQVLVVFQQNGLSTELDKDPDAPPAEWRLRVHAARRRAFLVVRSLVRLKREVKRLGAPVPDLGWLLPVAGAERWGEVKALAARCRTLEGVLQDSELAIEQLTALKEAQQPKRVQPLKAGAGRNGTAPGRISRSRVSTSSRTVSESGASPARTRPRSTLTADPPPPPTASSRRLNVTSSSTDYGAMGTPGLGMGLSPGRGQNLLVRKTSDLASSAPLVPTLSPLRVASGSSGVSSPLPSPYNSRRLSGSGGAPTPTTPPHLRNGAGTILPPAGSILSSSPAALTGAYSMQHRTSTNGIVPASTTVQAAGQPQGPASPQPRALIQQVTLQRPSGPSNTLVVRQTFIEGADGIPLPAPSSPAPQPGRTSTVQVLDVRTGSPFASAPLMQHSAEHATDASLHLPPAHNPPVPAPGGGGGAARRGPTAQADTVAPQHRTHTRTWGVTVEPSPPPMPPPGTGARRPAPPGTGTNGTLSPRRFSAGPTQGTVAPNGGLSVVPPAHADEVPSSAVAAGASVAPTPMQQLILDGETVEQALMRFTVAAEDARGALVDTARQFRAVLDLCNSTWADQRWWLAAHTQEDAASDWWPASEEYMISRADVVRCLKAGAVAFQFQAFSEDPLVGPGGTVHDWWTADPWEVAADLAPEEVYGGTAAQQAATEQRMVGLPVGVRVLQQLANAVLEAAGPGALEQLPIILHISERQRETILADLLQYSIYKRLRRNLFLVVQRSQPTMRYCSEARAYVPAPDQPAYTPGTGYAMLQLLWPGHATFLNDAGELQRLPHSLMAELNERKTEWFVSRNVSDLAILLDDGPLDLRTLSHVSHMWNTPHLRYSMAIEAVSTYAKHRELIAMHGSVLLCRKPKVSGMVTGRLDGTVRVDRYGGAMGLKPQLPVVELAACELNSAHMQAELSEIAGGRGTTTSVGMGRYIFRFEVLSKLLTGPTVLRPKLLPIADVRASGPKATVAAAAAATIAAANAAAEAAAAGRSAAGAPAPTLNNSTSFNTMTPFLSSGGLEEQQLSTAAQAGLDTVMLRLRLTMTDLSMHHGVKVVAMRAHRLPVVVRGPQDGGALVELLRRSDADLARATQRLAARLPSFSRQNKPAQNILVFVQDNGPSLTATNVAAGLARRERGDRIHMLVVVPTDAQRGEGAALLERYMKAFRTAADVTTHVLAQDGRGLLECMREVVEQQLVGLIVIGSASITSAPNGVMRGSGPPGTASKLGTAARAGAAAAAKGAEEANAEMLLSSVALSVLRTFGLPTIIVTANTKHYLRRHGVDAAAAAGGRPGASGAAVNLPGRLSAMVVVERHSRPMLHHIGRYLLEPSLRHDTLVLAQVLPPGLGPSDAGYDPSSIAVVALKTVLANFESIAAGNDFHTPIKVTVQGDWHFALCAAAREHGSQLMACQLGPGATRSLPSHVLQLIRSAPCPVLVYPERVDVAGAAALLNAEASEQAELA